jgi:hypothetical protein
VTVCAFTRRAALALGATVVLGSPPGAAAQTQPPIAIGATAVQRQEAARALVPLLEGVKQRAEPAVTIKPGTLPNSPFTGRQTTLFAFTVSRRSLPVDSRVVAAIDRLIAWHAEGPADDDAVLFDEWLAELTSRSAAAALLAGQGVCDTACVVTRMTTLDETWGRSPRNRAELRDETLLDALSAVVTK